MTHMYTTYRCTSNCGEKVIQSKSLKIFPECKGQLCSNVDNTKWSILLHRPTSKGKQWKEFTHKTIVGLKYPPRSLFANWSSISARDFVFKLKAVIELRAKREIIKEEYFMKFTLNSSPFTSSDTNSGCFVKPENGYAVSTTFNISCSGWRDEDEPLTYEYRYYTSVGLVINGPITLNTLSTKLPVGDWKEDYSFPVDIYIRDSLGDFSTERVLIKVWVYSAFTSLSGNCLLFKKLM